MQQCKEKLQFREVLQLLANKCQTERGKDLALNLDIIPEIALKEEKKRLVEMDKLISSVDAPSISNSPDLRTILERCLKGAILSPLDLERVATDISIGASLVHHIKKANDVPLLLEKINVIVDLQSLEKQIHHIIAPDLSIPDSASPTLRSVRGSIKRIKEGMVGRVNKILNANKEFLSETNLTLRNGHYVLPVAISWKNKVKGIIQDVSASGATAFIEPEEIVELNNRLTELDHEEREEIARLLRVLSEEVAKNSNDLEKENSTIAYFDLLSAKVRYGLFLKGHVAESGDGREISLIGARHPLLDSNKVVANSFFQKDETRGLLISGPNAGGKTVALKTLGILALMNQCGLMIPAEEGAILPFFKNIYVDIGDSQSLSDNLSTFSAHMKNISEILLSVGGKDLCLLDEVGTGTSPKEGEAIAYAVISSLLLKHCFFLVSSHFEGLKAFALSTSGLNNASMIFDEANLAPTYRLQIGLPGESYGLVVAKRYGLPPLVIQKAESYLKQEEDFSVSNAIKKLSEATFQSEKIRADLESKLASTEKKERELASKEASLRHKEIRLNDEVEEEKKLRLKKSEEKIKEIMASLSKPDLKLHEAIKAKKSLEDLSSKNEEEHFSETLKIGDYVDIPSVFGSGKIVRIVGQKAEVASRDGFTYKVGLNKLYRVDEPPAEEKSLKPYLKIDDIGKAKGVGLEINLIGQHVDEATEALSKYLDQCRIKGFKRVRIIHGLGSGALRNMVADYTHCHQEFIESIERAGESEGGLGATIVHLR